MELAVIKSELALPQTLANKLSKLHTEIILAKNNSAGMDTPDIFRRCVAYVISILGINKIPNLDEAGLLLTVFSRKFGTRINADEFKLAFEKNMNGEFEKYLSAKTKVEHFQLFSSEFMCDVLNLYLKDRGFASLKFEGLKEEEMRLALKPSIENPLVITMREIVCEKQNIDKVAPIKLLCTTSMKLECMYGIFGLNPKESLVIGLRKKAISEIIRDWRKEKSEARRDEKFGTEIELSNRIARVNSGMCLTTGDEKYIQIKVVSLLYYHYLNIIPEDMLINGLQQNIESLTI